MVYSYKSFQDLASRLIGDKGREVTIVYKTDGIYNPNTNTITRNYEDSVQVKAFFKTIKSNEVQDDMAETQEKSVLISALAIDVPKINDVLIDGDQEYTIIDVQTLQPGNETIVYEVKIRR